MTPTDKPMTVDVLEAIAREVGQMERRHCIGRSQGFDIRDGYAKLRAAIEQYGREQGFESTAQRDVREACYELRDALGNPVISGTGDQTIQGQTIRMAAARLRGSGAPVAVEPIIDAYLDGYETAYDEGSSAPDADTKFVIKEAIMGLLADDEFVKAVTPQPREPLTNEQIDRHTILAQECPPGSKVILVSSLRRLRAHGIRSKS